MTQLWGGRFTGQMDAFMARFNASLPFDWRLWGRGHHRLHRLGEGHCGSGPADRGRARPDRRGPRSLTGGDCGRSRRRLSPAQRDEDIHSYVERRLTETIGPVAGKLHTGRSRNDQVATDVRLWLKAEAADLAAALDELIAAAADRAEAEIDVLMPGYTHVQPAQPVRWSHWLLSHAWPWRRDAERLADLLKRVGCHAPRLGRARRLPLPHRPASAGRQTSASPRVSPNSMDAVSDRDFVAEFLFWAALTGIHLSRFAEDLVLWSSREFGFVVMDDAFSTGSSLMPQKKNPDAAELLRGKSARLVGHLTGAPDAAQGAAQLLRQGPAGGQGAAVRRGRHPRRRAAGGHRACSRR